MSKSARLRSLIEAKRDKALVAMGCHDALSARLIQDAGFEVCFFSGYALSSSRLAMPDVGLATYSEMVEAGRAACDATTIPIIGDGDTGYGGILNVRRTIEGYARAGFAGITIEDQTHPKRCTYAKGVQVVSFDESVERVKAALRARNEMRARDGIDLVIVARTDARKASNLADPLEEALRRCDAFAALGADVVYAEGLQGGAEMRRLTGAMKVPTMLAQVERPGQPVISPAEACSIGYTISLRGVTLLNAYITAVQKALKGIREDRDLSASGELLPFEELYRTVGFEEAYQWEESTTAGTPAV